MTYEVFGDNEATEFDAAIDAGWLDPADLSKAMRDVIDERDRQVTAEGWSPEHDDQHADGEMAFAASAYAEHASRPDKTRRAREKRRATPLHWPWAERWFKPKDRRRDLVRAAALIVAEIERLDRAAARGDAS